MSLRAAIAAVAAASALAAASGCAWNDVRNPAGAYVDDAAITTTIKARMVEDKAIDASAIDVETRYGNVTLSGAAKDEVGKQTAGHIAIKVKGVKTVQNNVVVRP